MPAFTTLPLTPDQQATLAALGLVELTPIQAAAIPPLLEGRDVIGHAETGSGKTLAYVLPLLHGLRPERVVQALILAPTRELSAQVAREVRRVGRHLPGLRVLVLAGGQPASPQARALQEGVHVVVGTPGRLVDHLERGSLVLQGLRTLVLDEADRMLDMGFHAQVQRVLQSAPEARQTALFSATFPDSIAALSARCQRQAVHVRIAEESAPIRHVAYLTEPDDKAGALLAVLAEHQPAQAIVFCNLKATVSYVTDDLLGAGWSAAALHGDLEQFDRDRVLAQFRNRSLRLLVATDVAARGLDIANLDAVVQVDLPAQPEIYVHRTGRTGRAGRTGLAVSLVTPREKEKLARIEDKLPSPVERQQLRGAAPAEVAAAEMRTLRIGGGRKDKVRPGDILGALTGEAGFSAKDVGKIEIHDHFAYVAVAAAIADGVLAWFAEGKLKGRRFRVRPVE